MADDRSIQKLVELALDRSSTPEEVCREQPELLPAVQERWRRVREIEAQLDQFLPSPTHAARASTHGPGDEGELPALPGYEVQAVLGMGGMGIVYRAVQLKLQRTVAVKMARAGLHATPEEMACLMLEARAVARLRHPGIVQVYDVGEHDGRPYFSMEFIENGSLAGRLNGAPQPPRDAAELAAALADGVAAAHAGGVVHRDLKPGNILIAGDGSPKIADFSLARRFEPGLPETLTGAAIGTPSYMAPEQVLGRAGAFCPAVDIYALGAVLYEMLTGRPPFRAETPMETQRQVVSAEPAPPGRLNPRVPRDLETICLTCLRKDPARRYASAAALAQDLRRFLRGEPISARPTSLLEVAAKWVRRRPGAATAVAAVATLALVVGGTAVWLGAQRSAIIRAAGEDLLEVRERAARAEWKEARIALDRAKVRLGPRDDASLRAGIAAAEVELALVDRLGDIQLRRVAGRHDFDRPRADLEYQDAFERAGLFRFGETPRDVAERLAASPIRAAIVGALDDWTICANAPERRKWIMEVTRRTDPDPHWRDQIRSPEVWGDPAALDDLARRADVAREPVTALFILARLLDSVKGDALGLLRRVQFVHPDDFWCNFVLAELLDGQGNPEAIGLYRAALAARPDAAASWVNLGVSLSRHNRIPEAEDLWRHALTLEPGLWIARHNLAIGALARGEFDQAAEHGELALGLDPNAGATLAVLGTAYFRLGRSREAIPLLERAIELLPPGDETRTGAQYVLGRSQAALALEARLDGLVRGVDHPKDADEGLAVAGLLLGLGEPAAAVRFYRDAFAANPELTSNLRTQHRYNAACAAALAAAQADPAIDDADQSRLRRLATDWLQADLSLWADPRSSADPAWVQSRTETMTHWKADPDLASLREGSSILRLPPAEREELTRLWSEVETFLQR